MYDFSYTDKLQILKNTESPKIVFIGGSNLAYGIDSEKISEELNINVVNMGVNAGFGLKFIIDSTYNLLNKNDILILIPEYQHFFSIYSAGTSPTVYNAYQQANVPLNKDQIIIFTKNISQYVNY